MPSAQRRARERENLRRAILDAARELFVTESYDAVSMRRIAAKIEYSPAAIYTYFQDKDEIFLCLAEEGFALLGDRMQQLNEISDVADRMRRMGRCYLDFAFTQPQYYRIMFEIPHDATTLEKYAERHLALGNGAFYALADCVQEAITQGLFRPDLHPLVAATCIWATVHGAASLTLSKRLTKLPEEAHPAFYASVIEMAIQGFRRG